MRIGIPGGRLAKHLPRLSVILGREVAEPPYERSLYWRGPDEYFRLRAKAIPALVAQGLLDFGICGSDSISEFLMPELLDVRDLGPQVGVRMVVAAADPAILRMPLGRPLVVGTTYPLTASTYLGTRHGKSHIVVEQPGCIEGLCPMLVDMVVDVSETGETLEANGLQEIEDLGQLRVVTVTRKGT